ncbi:MAG: DUF4126 domain-containing protein [Chloroflexi bacterium]|nr:DUF4126 domain-containing protein [Chloroflexota bacterium]
MEAAGGLLEAFGLAASAGLNAYVPLLIVAVTARFTNMITLSAPWDVLSSGWVIAALLILGLIEFFADKVPAVNHVNDILQTLIRPTAGAILFAASSNVLSDIHPIVAMIAGLVVAGSVHVVKSAAVRPVVSATTGGAGNVPVSIAEDVLAAGLSILAIVIPIVVAAFIILGTTFIIWFLWRKANKITRIAEDT